MFRIAIALAVGFTFLGGAEACNRAKSRRNTPVQYVESYSVPVQMSAERTFANQAGTGCVGTVQSPGVQFRTPVYSSGCQGYQASAYRSGPFQRFRDRRASRRGGHVEVQHSYEPPLASSYPVAKLMPEQMPNGDMCIDGKCPLPR